MPADTPEKGTSVFSVCDAAFEGESAEIRAGDGEEPIRVAVDCPDYGAVLMIVGASTLSDAIGADLRIERHE